MVIHVHVYNVHVLYRGMETASLAMLEQEASNHLQNMRCMCPSTCIHVYVCTTQHKNISLTKILRKFYILQVSVCTHCIPVKLPRECITEKIVRGCGREANKPSAILRLKTTPKYNLFRNARECAEI